MPTGRTEPTSRDVESPAEPRSAGADLARSGARRAGRMTYDAALKFYADGCPTLAAAISFYALLSLIPVLFMAIAVVGYVVGSSQETFRAIVSSVRDFIPHLSTDITRNLESVVDNRGRLSWLALTALVIAAGLVFQATEFALDRVFEVERGRSFLRSRLLSMVVVVTMGFVLLFSFYVGVIFHALNADPEIVPFGHAVIVSLARGLRIQYLVSVTLVLALFTVALRIFPHAPVSWRHALAGGVVGTVLWEVARRFFLWYLTNIAQFSVVYGSLGALVAVLVWIYFSVTIFLFAAECVVALQRTGGPRQSRALAARRRSAAPTEG
jgi:membrane protein